MGSQGEVMDDATHGNVEASARDKLVQLLKKVWDDINFEGPDAGGKLLQFRYQKNALIIRLDYHGLPGSEGEPCLHMNVEGRMLGGKNYHLELDPRRLFDNPGK